MESHRVSAVFTALLALAALTQTAPASAEPGPMVFPGMEIHQGTTLCTLGYVDIPSRSALTAGHCRGDGPVTDRDGDVIGTLTMFRDNTPDGTTITPDDMITDWEAIALASDVQIGDMLPSGHPLVADGGMAVRRPGQPVCHFGIATGESCGTVEAVNNGWFTMDRAVASEKGDSGGPVYIVTADGRAAIVGLFNSTWGQFPAAVSWQSTSQQIVAAQVSQSSSSNTGMAGAISHNSTSEDSGVRPPG